MNEVEALRKARNLSSLMRLRYLSAMERLPACPARTLLAQGVAEADECIETLSGMIDVRDPNSPPLHLQDIGALISKETKP